MRKRITKKKMRVPPLVHKAKAQATEIAAMLRKPTWPSPLHVPVALDQCTGGSFEARPRDKGPKPGVRPHPAEAEPRPPVAEPHLLVEALLQGDLMISSNSSTSLSSSSSLSSTSVIEEVSVARDAEGVQILQGLGFPIAYTLWVLIPTVVLNNVKSPQSRPMVLVGTSVTPMIEESSFSRPPNRKNWGGRKSRQ